MLLCDVNARSRGRVELVTLAVMGETVSLTSALMARRLAVAGGAEEEDEPTGPAGD